MISTKKEMQIRRAILKFEKDQNIYAPFYLGNGEHQNSMDGKETETRLFKLRVIVGIPGCYHTGGHVAYDVYDKKEEMRYKVRHYFPNKQFANYYGWHLEKTEETENE